MRTKFFALLLVGSTLVSEVSTIDAADITPSLSVRFANAEIQESPNFQKHVVPLFGRLGCNGRACHGSFQGRGDFRLSLFGYDFKLDHEALLDAKSPRVNRDNPLESLILAKPTDEDLHEGGQRYEKDSWQYHVFRRWVESGATFEENQVQKLLELKLVPDEIQFSHSGEQVQFQAIAIWEDGRQEDVTPLCRFQTNDDQIAVIDENGLVTATNTGDTHLVVSYDQAVVAVPVLRPVTDRVAANYPAVETTTKIDELVVNKLRKLGIVPSELCTDAEFLRRARLDITGTLPTPQEVEEFLKDEASDKRAKLIDRLLETPAYAAWWTTKLCDFTGNNEQQLNNASPLRDSPSRQWYEWIYKRVEDNTPYDKLAEGIITGVSMKEGQTYREYCEEMSQIYRDQDKSYADLPNMTYFWAKTDFRDVEARAIGFAYSFMGLRIQCAQCHKHPFDQWSKNDFHQFKNFFARVTVGNANNAGREFREEYTAMVKELGLEDKRGNQLTRELPALLKQGKTIPFPVTSVSRALQRTRNPDGEYPSFDYGKLLGGDVVDVKSVDDPRTELMDWLRSSENRFFAPAFVNRVWASYFHRGIVTPADDMSLGNPPSNKPLLDYLSQGFIASGFDMKWLHREIVTSDTYQRSWQTNETNAKDERNFSHVIPRRLPAEVAYDAIQQATASDERIEALVSSNSGRAIALPEASARRNANNNDLNFALSVFGRSTRESNCDCDRSEEPALLQTVYLQNDANVLNMIGERRGSWLDQVAQEIAAPEADGFAQINRRIESLESELANLERRLPRLKKNANEKMLRQAETRQQQLKKQITGLQGELAAKQEQTELDSKMLEKFVTQAYLRSVSRYPTPNELARAEQYILESANPLEGFRDVLWAVLNTKEFIVNH